VESTDHTRADPETRLPSHNGFVALGQQYEPKPEKLRTDGRVLPSSRSTCLIALLASSWFAMPVPCDRMDPKHGCLNRPAQRVRNDNTRFTWA
jgi:hypothetical protein